MRKSLTLIFFCLISRIALGGNVHGKITNARMEPLAYATIYVDELKTGTAANNDGFYFINLPPGRYKLVFQYLGYKTQVENIEIAEGDLELNVILLQQDILLQNVIVNAKDEDPAYAIMRNVIAKSKYHLNQLDSSSSTVYIKGKGKALKIPFWFRKQLKKEGIDTSSVFIKEMITKVKYKRPNSYSEEVISIKSNGDDHGTDPMPYINASFYNPDLANTISPLSPKAFSYYKFTYLGTHNDRGHEVSKIKVTPRSKGDNVFEGVIEIVENDWSIYSLDLKVMKMGIKVGISQIYAPVENGVWLPISHKYNIRGMLLGIEFVFNYFAAVSDYKVFLNKELPMDITIVQPAKVAEKISNIKELEAGGEVSGKELKKAMRKYEKEETKKSVEPEVVYERNFVVDSMATKKDSIYWVQNRPIPLADDEQRGYVQQKERIIKAKVEQVKDSVNQKKNNTLWMVTGRSFKIGKHSRINVGNLLTSISYNTVEGYRGTYVLRYENSRWPSKTLSFGPDISYSLARNRISATMNVDYRFNNSKQLNEEHFGIRAGRAVSQFNRDKPISTFNNSLMSLIFRQNHMKLYEKDFVALGYSKNYRKKFGFGFQTELAERWELFNYRKIAEREEQVFTPNAPEHHVLGTISFPKHRSFVSSVVLSYRPWIKFSVSNGVRQVHPNTSPEFRIKYEKGISGVFDSETDFDKLSVGVEQVFNFGVRGRLAYDAEVGAFLNKNNLYFMDFFHFRGNKTPFLPMNDDSFRLLDYYRYSTADRYFKVNANYQQRKLLLTRIPSFQMLGIRESLIANNLITPSLDHYTEIGYRIDHIFRIFRVEAVTSFANGKYDGFGIRLGLINRFEF